MMDCKGFVTQSASCPGCASRQDPCSLLLEVPLMHGSMLHIENEWTHFYLVFKKIFDNDYFITGVLSNI